MQQGVYVSTDNGKAWGKNRNNLWKITLGTTSVLSELAHSANLSKYYIYTLAILLGILLGIGRDTNAY